MNEMSPDRKIRGWSCLVQFCSSLRLFLEEPRLVRGRIRYVKTIHGATVLKLTHRIWSSGGEKKE